LDLLEWQARRYVPIWALLVVALVGIAGRGEEALPSRVPQVTSRLHEGNSSEVEEGGGVGRRRVTGRGLGLRGLKKLGVEEIDEEDNDGVDGEGDEGDEGAVVRADVALLAVIALHARVEGARLLVVTAAGVILSKLRLEVVVVVRVHVLVDLLAHIEGARVVVLDHVNLALLLSMSPHTEFSLPLNRPPLLVVQVQGLTVLATLLELVGSHCEADFLAAVSRHLLDVLPLDLEEVEVARLEDLALAAEVLSLAVGVLAEVSLNLVLRIAVYPLVHVVL